MTSMAERTVVVENNILRRPAAEMVVAEGVMFRKVCMIESKV